MGEFIAYLYCAEVRLVMNRNVRAECHAYVPYGSVYYWDTVYHAIFPAWFRWPLPIVYGLLSPVLALAAWRVSILAPKWPAACFSLLDGLVSLVGHGIGMSRGCSECHSSDL